MGSADCNLADKLNTFAPHTTVVQLNVGLDDVCIILIRKEGYYGVDGKTNCQHIG